MQQLHTTTHNYYTRHGCCRLLADGKGIFYMECHHSFIQFWTADLDPVTLGRATEHVYATFFYSPSSHTLHQQSDKIIFGHIVITLNAAFDQQLSLADEGYESGSDTNDLPTPLRKTLRIHHVSSMEHASFDPAPVTPCSTPQTPPRPVCRCLSFSSADSYTPNSTPEYSEEEEEDFQTVPLEMNIGFLRKHLKGHYVFMSMVYHMDYVHTHALSQTIKCPLTWAVWI